MSVSIHIGQCGSFCDKVGRWAGASSLVRTGAIWGLLVLVMPPLACPEDLSLPSAIPIPPTVEEIELSYSGEQTTPAVTLSGAPAVMPPLSYRPFAPILELRTTFGEARPFGSCQVQHGRMQDGIELQRVAGAGTRCGQRIPLDPAEIAVDLLSYETVRIRGRATGRVVVALEDVAASRREDNVPIATVTGPFDLTVSLKEIGRKLDLRSLTAFVVSTDEPHARIELDHMEAALRPSEPVRPHATGFWVWKYREAIDDPDALIGTCRAQHCSRVLIQMPSQAEGEALWRDYARLLMTVREAGVEVFALDGYTEAIQEPGKLADKIQRLLTLTSPGVLSGVQLDIEPYLVPGFLQDEAQLGLYVRAIETLKEAIGGRTRLSMVIPFWLVSPTIDGRPLAYAVMDRADEVAVMTYRTEVEELQEIAEDILRYGDLVGTPVWLAIETTALPVEQHMVLRRELDPARADAVLDYERRLLQWLPLPGEAVSLARREWFRLHHRFTVRPERLTFYGHSRTEVAATVRQILDTTRHQSFMGVIIHDLDGFRALSE